MRKNVYTKNSEKLLCLSMKFKRIENRGRIFSSFNNNLFVLIIKSEAAEIFSLFFGIYNITYFYVYSVPDLI